MKNLILFLIMCLLTIITKAQITISGATNYPGLNLTFMPVSSVPTTDCYISNIDAGTNAYKSTVVFPPVGTTPG
jgi:hypothetical protein